MDPDSHGSEHGAEPPGWTFVTVTYNNASQLRESWSGIDLAGHRWLVIDNNSTDNSAQVAESLGAEVVRRSDNRGFSASNNIGLEMATSEWIAFVNPDLTPDLRSLERIEKLSSTHSALIAPQLVNFDGSFQPNARGFPTVPQKLANRGLGARRIDTSRYTRASFESPTYIAWAMGAAICGPRAIFDQLGGWDSRYFIYYEDHDLGLRAWQQGHPVILDPDSRWIHAWQRETTSFRLAPWKHELRSALIFYRDYPELLLTRRRYESGRFAGLASQLWRPATINTHAPEGRGVS
ncbi:MAG TPA: glycosyltransferase family 2 protein [Nocardioides sp.]|uniref:glycosyltransferase family 2 protein n=1 Tax=Nocardioides sp. TaxID=35761 RepID=UPI002B96B8C6|nr:glycosyltransferase family 2 protein [Nocardioides sp.]HTW17517.1 glycosyltransferase family 2 protein [Nocardioides sp.]